MRLSTSNLLLLTLLLIIFLPTLFMQGMFMDGLIYSAVSKNVSINFFNQFHLKMSETFLSEFYEQPPLVFYLQGLFIKLFGDSFFVDRLYSYFCFAISALLIIRIANKFTSLKNNAWLALAFFVCVPVISWSFKNNMLENTMCVFCLASAYVSLNYYKNKAYSFLFYCLINSIFLIAAFLCKGFTGLFLLSFPFFYHLFNSTSKLKGVTDTLGLLVMLILLAIVLFLIMPSLFNYMLSYFKSQVVASINGAREVDGHFFIVTKMLQELTVLIVLTFLLHLRFKTNIFTVLREKIRMNTDITLFLFLGLAGSLPIMISPKQSGYYVLCAYPFFAMLFALINVEECAFIVKLIKQFVTDVVFRKVLFVLLIIPILLMLLNYKKFNRDEEKLLMVNGIANIIGNNSLLTIDSSLSKDYSLYGYFSRLHNISLSKEVSNHSYYLLINNEMQELVSIGVYKLDSANYYLYHID